MMMLVQGVKTMVVLLQLFSYTYVLPSYLSFHYTYYLIKSRLLT